MATRGAQFSEQPAQSGTAAAPSAHSAIAGKDGAQQCRVLFQSERGSFITHGPAAHFSHVGQPARNLALRLLIWMSSECPFSSISKMLILGIGSSIPGRSSRSRNAAQSPARHNFRRLPAFAHSEIMAATSSGFAARCGSLCPACDSRHASATARDSSARIGSAAGHGRGIAHCHQARSRRTPLPVRYADEFSESCMGCQSLSGIGRARRVGFQSPHNAPPLPR